MLQLAARVVQRLAPGSRVILLGRRVQLEALGVHGRQPLALAHALILSRQQRVALRKGNVFYCRVITPSFV